MVGSCGEVEMQHGGWVWTARQQCGSSLGQRGWLDVRTVSPAQLPSPAHLNATPLFWVRRP